MAVGIVRVSGAGLVIVLVGYLFAQVFGMGGAGTSPNPELSMVAGGGSGLSSSATRVSWSDALGAARSSPDGRTVFKGLGGKAKAEQERIKHMFALDDDAAISYLARRQIVDDVFDSIGLTPYHERGMSGFRQSALRLWVLDLDGDGILTAEELREAVALERRFDAELRHFRSGAVQFQGDFASMAMPTVADVAVDETWLIGQVPVLLALEADKDGDGVVSVDEVRGWRYEEIMDLTDVLRTSTEYALAVSLDANDNGDFDDEEKRAFEKANAWYFQHGVTLDTPWIDGRALAGIRETDAYLKADIGSGVIMSALPKLSPPPIPSHDRNGDGVVNSIDRFESDEARAAFREASYLHGREGRWLAMSQGADSNADGRISDDEFETYLVRGSDAAASKAIASVYDVDGDGRYSGYELDRFSDRYRRKALLADINADGAVDVGDMSDFARVVVSRP